MSGLPLNAQESGTTTPPHGAQNLSALPADFSFSQSSLQAYEDCPRRFWLAYVQQLPWPALEAAPALAFEEQLRWGSVFHKLVERAETELQVEGGELPAPLAEWWQAYLDYRPTDLDLGRREVEFVLTSIFNLDLARTADGVTMTTSLPVRLAAKYDLVAIIDDGPVIIVDWKTGARRPQPETIQRKWQSWLYPYILVEAAPYLDWGPIAPERVELRYWFAADPGNPIVLPYSQQRHRETTQRLRETLRAIHTGTTEADFPKIPDTETNRRRFCQFCVYRSRCDRGTRAGLLEDTLNSDLLEDTLEAEMLDASLDFTLDDVDELAF